MTSEQELAVELALKAYWTSRDEARLAQINKGTVDLSERLTVTQGGHLDRIAQLLAKECIDAGAPWKQVYYRAPGDDPNKRDRLSTGYTLPGYYRPTKQWDVVVHYQGRPIIAIELKSQNGPSYGNNANNRAEEAIGNAVDLTRACEEGLIAKRPWTGYVFVIESDLRSERRGGQRELSFLAKAEIFNNWSYTERIRILCERLTQEGLYNSTWAVATSRPVCPAKDTSDPEKRREKCPQIAASVPEELHNHIFGWRELDTEISGYAQFVKSLVSEIREYYPAPAEDARNERRNVARGPRRGGAASNFNTPSQEVAEQLEMPF